MAGNEDGSGALTNATQVPKPRPAMDAEPIVVGGRFTVIDLIRRNPSTMTAVAVDGTSGESVVVKAANVEQLSRATRIRLRHEAEVLHALGGRGLVPLIASGEADGLFYLVMPRVAGRTLRARLQAGPLGSELALLVTEQLLETLVIAHGHGILHRDIKPDNVMVSEDEPPVVRLVDWGLSRSDGLDPDIRDEPVGTAMYMSPEVAGTLRDDVDERSDLYSVGVVLHECLTGAPPYTGATVGEVLRHHLTAPPPDPRTVDPAVPTIVVELVGRLLRKDPRDRYQTAQGALADVRSIRDSLAAGQPDPDFVLGTHDVRRLLTEPAFVGRRAELADLMRMVDDAANGLSSVLLVEAESGGGKSRLLEELATRLNERDAMVLRGQAVDQAARLPYQMLDGVVGDLLAAAAEDHPLRDRLRASLEADAESIVDALPEMAELLGTTSDTGMQAPPEFGETRTLTALTRLLDCLGESDRVTVVLLDDCQWADDAMKALLARWQRERLESGLPNRLAIIAAFRGEEVPVDDPLRRVSSRGIGLRPLDESGVAALLESMAGDLPAPVTAAVQRLSDGSPFMASAVLRGLVETGALFADQSGWRVDESLLESVQSSREAAVLLGRRLGLLPDDVLSLLRIGAVLGKQFEVDTAARLAALDGDAAIEALRLVQARHIVWLDRTSTVAAFVHDKLRETLLGQIDAVHRQHLHQAIAEDLERRGDASAYDLAFHFSAAGEPSRALPYALIAAEEARARHSLAAAEAQFRIAAEGLGPSDTALRARIASGLADVLMLRGSYVEAERHFKEALEVLKTPTARADVERRLGELAFKRGDVLESVGYLEQALRALGRRVPRSHLTYAIWAVWEVLVQAVHTILPSRWISRRSLLGADVDLLGARIYSRLAYSYWFSKGRAPTAWAHLREMNLLERYPPSLELAQAYSEHAPVASTLPWFSRGREYARRSLQIRREFGDVWGQGQSLHFYGVVLYAGSRFTESIELLTEAIRLLERTGDRWEIHTALWHLGFCHYRLGNLDDARRAFERCHASAAEVGDHQALGIALSGLSKVSAGAVEAEAMAAALEDCKGDLHTTGEVITGEAIRLLAAGQPKAAADLLAEGHRAVAKARVRNEYVAPILPWRVTALRTAAESVDGLDNRERRRLLRCAVRTSWRARLIAAAYRNNLPHVLREQATVALMRGRERAAKRLIAHGIEVARELSMEGELQALLALQERAPWTAGSVDDAAEAARVAVGDDEVVASLSLADRFETLLGVGRTIATALTEESIWLNVRRASVELLRGESSSVVLINFAADGAMHLVPMEGSDEVASEQLIAKAAADGTVVSWTDQDADPTESMLFNRTRCALAAPVYCRGVLVACWSVAHSGVRSLFGADEIRIAEYISALAGAALENAEGFAEVQALSHSLEQRVAQRTVELEHANAELRRLDELKSEFVAMTSHELRSPLTSMLGFCRTALKHWDRIDDEKKRDFMTTVEKQGTRLAVLTEDLLQMARIESGHLRTSLEAVGLRELCEEVIDDFSGRSTAISITGPEVAALADREHLRRIVINLVDNALKYGEPPVELTVDHRGDRLLLTVRDNGAGVPDDFVPRLFDRFAQASSGTTRRSKGTGLGMAIVRGLAEAMNASITYHPARGGGAEFQVDLPAAGVKSPE